MAADAPAAFFSYSRDDSGFALRLAGELKAAGANVWIDQLDIEPGARWDRAVRDALANCPRMLVVLSPGSVDSENVLDEIDFALERRKTIIPVLYLECEIPLRLRRVQHIDYRTDQQRGFRLLLKALGVAEKPQPSVDHPTVDEPQARPRSAEQSRLEEVGAEQIRLQEEQKAVEQARMKEELRQAVELAGLDEERVRAEVEKAREEQLQRELAEAPGKGEGERQQTEPGIFPRSPTGKQLEGLELAEHGKGITKFRLVAAISLLIIGMASYFAWRYIHSPVLPDRQVELNSTLPDGQVELNPAPWATVISIKKSSGESVNVVDLPAVTPLRLSLPPGNYVIEMKGPNEQITSVVLTVESGKTVQWHRLVTGFHVDTVVNELLR